MKNQEIYLKDPGANALLNDGVANVTDGRSEQELRILRYELETFVCKGEYAEGLRRILESFLGHVDEPQQPGIWVSGFYGSGKSHFVKMLRALWVDFRFDSDGATARSLVKLPPEVADPLRELSNRAKRLGGTHAASGRISAGAGDNVRLALLGIVFRSADLQEQYALARFEMWMKSEGLYDGVRAAVEGQGKAWGEEVQHLYVSKKIAEALLVARPDFAPNESAARAQLRAQFPAPADVTNDEMVSAIKTALSSGGKFPLTLVALDEIQQYIGELPQRSIAIQEITETCERAFKSRLLFVGTGQSALSGTALLTRLKARFPIAIELSDTDVDRVIREVILAKKPACMDPVKTALTANVGEISRHLAGTKLEHRGDDTGDFVADYPLLPVRRRFWERALRAVDQAGTAGQLRNQLKMVHEGAKITGDKPLGTVVAGDFVFDANESELVQTAVLPREIYDHIRKLKATGDATDRLKARLLGLVFLIGKLPSAREPGADLGVRATPDVLVDLLVEDLDAGSSELRKTVPGVLQALEEDGRVMLVDNEYRVQTRESVAWNNEYRTQLQKILDNPQRVAQERSDLFRKECAERLKGVVGSIRQGVAKVPRTVALHFGDEAPKNTDGTIDAWIRDGWDVDESAVVADAKAAGNQSPLLYVFVPKREADDLKKQIGTLRAAKATLDIRGVPTGTEGPEARNAMETRRALAELRLRSLVDVIFSGAHVFQGGGQEVLGATLADAVKQAAEHALVRLFPRFHLADYAGWEKVLTQAKGGNGGALDAIGYKGDPEKHAVTAEILKYVGGGKKGLEIRKDFEGGDRGWPQDAVDAAIHVLLLSGHLRATDNNSQPIESKALDRWKLTTANFRVEGITLTVPQKIALRGLFQNVGLTCKANEELQSVAPFVEAMKGRAVTAGGEAPRPAIPDMKLLAEVSAKTGNGQLHFIYEQRDALGTLTKEWDDAGKNIAQRMPRWIVLAGLLLQARALPEAIELQKQTDAIRDGRLLLAKPDPVSALADQATQLLRTALIAARQAFQDVYDAEMATLSLDTTWARLNDLQRVQLLSQYDLVGIPAIATGTEAEVLASLKSMALDTWSDRREALPNRFAGARLDAAKLLEPKAIRIKLPPGMLKDEAAVKNWLAGVEATLMAKVKEGPLVV